MRATIPFSSAGALARTVLERTGDGAASLLGVERDDLARSPDAAARTRFLVERALAGDDARVAEQCLDASRRLRGRVALHLLALLAAGRCDVAAWLTLLADVEHVNLPSLGRGGNVMSPDRPAVRSTIVLDAHVHLGGNVHWTPLGCVDAPPTLPRAVLASIEGRMLREVVSHPALDGFDWRITSLLEHETHVEAFVDFGGTDAEMRSIDFGDLAPELLYPDPNAVANIHRLARERALRAASDRTTIEDMTTITA